MKKIIKTIGKVLLWVIISLLSIFIILLFLIRLPAVQNYISQKATSFISSKTHTTVALHRIFIGLPKSIVIEDFYAEDRNHDTLIFLGKLEIDVDLLGLLKNKLDVNELLIADLNGNIKRSLPDSAFNFAFIIDAFKGDAKTNVTPPIKDTTSSAWQVLVNTIKLKNINATYIDEVSGNDMMVSLGNLELSMKNKDIRNLHFDADKLLLADAHVSIIQHKSVKIDIHDTAVTIFPSLSLNDLRLSRFSFNYTSISDDQSFRCKGIELQIIPEKIDLNRQQIQLKKITLHNVYAEVGIKTDSVPVKIITPHKDLKTVDKGWLVKAGQLTFNDVSFKFDVINKPKTVYGMDYNHLYFKKVMMDMQDAVYSPERISSIIKNISLKEQCGLDLIKFNATATYDDKHAELENLTLVTSNSFISNYLKVSYPSINSLSDSIAVLGIQVSLLKTRVSMNDIFLFAPQLRDQPFFAGKKDKVITVDGNIHGVLKDIYLDKIKVQAERASLVLLDGHITGLPDAKKAFYDIKLRTLVTKRTDVLAWISQKVLPVAIPDHLLIQGNFNGSFSNFISDLSLQSSAGNFKVDAKMNMGMMDTLYEVALQTRNLNLGYLLNKPEVLGSITLMTKIKGKNFSPKRIKADVLAEVETIVLNKYRYRNIKISADASNGIFATALIVNDSNLRLNMQGGFSVIENRESIKMEVNLEGINLAGLKLTNDNIRASGKVNIDLKGKTIEELSGGVSLNSILVIKDDKKYRIDSFLVATVNDRKSSSLKMKTGFINIDYDGTVTLAHLKKALTTHIDHYFKMNDTLLTGDTSNQEFKLTVNVKPHPIINEVFLTKLEKFNGASIIADFNNKNQQLNIVVASPVIQYNGIKINDLKLEFNSDKNNLSYALAITAFKSGSINIPATSLKGKLQNNVIDFSLAVVHKDSGNKLLIAGNIKEMETEEKYILHIDQNLIFDNKKWVLPVDNFISFKNAGIYMHEITLTDHKQTIIMSSEGSDETSPLKIVFKKFELATLSQIIEKDTAIIRGQLNGTIELRNLQKSLAFVSDLKITDIVYMQNAIGDLDIQADNNSAGQQGRYEAHIALSGQDNKLDINGTYMVSENKKLDFKIDIGKLNLKSVEGFTGGQIRESSGYLSGKIHITGSGSEPLINGDIGFKNAGFNVAYINNYLNLRDDHIKIDPKGIYFKSFTILDASGKKASIDGAVYTSDFKKMRFDLTVKTNNFMVLNTNIKDNGLYFGTIILSSNIRVKGDESLPVINAEAKLLAGTHITFIVPSSQLSTDRGSGVVVMIDTTTTNDIMGKVDTAIVSEVFKGIDLTANIEINKQTSFKVIVDRVSGDSLVVKGEGLLSFGIDPSGKQSLTGTYLLNSGSYNASFQKVVKRDFKIKSGSTITWSGSPLDATLDITAIYRTRTAPADLLATELTGTVASEQNAYRKPIYFDVNMMMKGPLMRPEVTFLLDMDDRDKDAFGGIVYAKIGSLNNDPAELNKQVFSLLVLNKFVPSGSSTNTGESSAVNTIARNSVNQVLSDQLNQLSGKYIKDVELNFDIQSNDQYSATGVQQNTAVQVGLKKQFMNSRISVQVGSNINVQDNGSTSTNASNLTGDVIVEYKITEDGRYRFKAFRENQYAGIIDGLLYKTGVGVVYTRDFDTLKELRVAPKKEVDPQ
ncbi:MAG: translocation/assembly module TamB [Bacteroidia bacterium]|nr:translocation/assembly module TamB [Bacteroidia bacterium]